LAAEFRRLAAQKARFVAVTEHELRTPLTTIAAFAQLLGPEGEERELPDDQITRAVNAISRSTERMLLLLEDLALLNRIETAALAPEPIDLAALLDEVARAVRGGLPEASVKVSPTAGPLLTGDLGLLRQLLYATLGAVAATQGAVTASVGYESGAVTVTAAAPAICPLADEYLLATPLPTLEPPVRRRSAGLWMLLAEAVAARHEGLVEVSERSAGTAYIAVRLPVGG
jgi:light-regulated signal transduction histidine kinase (bacteriophytochrome)